MFRYTCLLMIMFTQCKLQAQQQRYTFTELKMASPFTIIFYAADSAAAARLSKACFERVDSLVNIFSDYIDSSELNRLCATAGSGQAFSCSSTLFDLLQHCDRAFRLSSGSFDITLGPLTRLWRAARKNKQFPTTEEIRNRLALTGFSKVVLDTVKRTACLLQRGMQLDLGGIAQGYIAQQTIDYLTQQKVASALVNVSGDIACTGAPPGKAGWTIAINMPESEDELLPRTLELANTAVTTSGDVYQYLEHNGQRYSHIIDPATGFGITTQRNVTVIAHDGTMADWLTKACSILPVKKALALARRLHATVLIAAIKNDQTKFYHSAGWKKLLKPFPVPRT